MKDKNYVFTCSSLHFICSDVPDLALGILKMLVPLNLSDVLLNE